MKYRRVARGVGFGLAAGALTALAADALRPRPGPARIVDWDEVRRRAYARVDDAARLTPSRRQGLEAEYRALAAEVEPPLLEFVGGLPAGLTLPPFQALDRHGWIDLNLGIVQGVVEPLLALEKDIPNNRIVELGRGAIDRYTAMLLGFLASRVLGQYDPQLLGREPALPGLYLVEPNILDFEDENLLPGPSLRRWLILHESTHGWQFAAHPWLRDHLNGLIEVLLSLALDRGSHPLDRLRAMTFGVREQISSVNTLQAVMSLIEGYSNLVMDEVGRRQIPEFDDLEEAHHRRASEKTIFERLFWRVTGLEMKLQQYVVGERFCREIYDRHGITALNRAWESPESLPSLDELKAPSLWERRVLGGRMSVRKSTKPAAGG